MNTILSTTTDSAFHLTFFDNITKFIKSINFNSDALISDALSVALILALTFIALKINKKVYKSLRNRITNSGQTNVSYLQFFQHATVAFIYFISIVSIISSISWLSSMTTTLLASSGIVAVVLGFASQEAMGNIVSGAMILMFKPFVIGDIIRPGAGTIVGTVEDISLRHTVIRTLENKRVIIPNGTMGSDVIENANYTETKVCTTFDIGIGYSSDIDLARKIITEACVSHKDFLDNRSDEDKDNGISPITVRVVDLASSSVTLRTWIWGENGGVAFGMKCDLLEIIKKEFDAQGVEIPFNQIVVNQPK